MKGENKDWSMAPRSEKSLDPHGLLETRILPARLNASCHMYDSVQLTMQIINLGMGGRRDPPYIANEFVRVQHRILPHCSSSILEGSFSPRVACFSKTTSHARLAQLLASDGWALQSRGQISRIDSSLII